MPLQQNLDMLAGRIAELLAQSETLGEAGDIDGAQAAIAQVETLKVGHGFDPNRDRSANTARLLLLRDSAPSMKTSRAVPAS